MKTANTNDVESRLKQVRLNVIGYDPVPMEMELFEPDAGTAITGERPETESNRNRINLNLFFRINSHFFIFGPVIVIIKKIVRKSLKWLLAPLIAQLNSIINAHQTYFDSYEARFREIDRRFSLINENFEDFKNRFNELRNSTDVFNNDLSAAKNTIKENVDRLAAIEFNYSNLKEIIERDRGHVETISLLTVQNRERTEGLNKEIEKTSAENKETEKKVESIRMLYDRHQENIEAVESDMKKIEDVLNRDREEVNLQIKDALNEAAEAGIIKHTEIEERIKVNHERLAELFEYLSDKVESYIDSQNGEISRISEITNRLDAYNINQRLNRVDRFISSFRMKELDQKNSGFESEVSPAKFDLSEVPKFDYYSFAEKFRGSEDLIKERQNKYVQFFKKTANVIDIGCGRGEFLELMRNNRIDSYGIDIDPDMVELCRDKGLKVFQEDAISHLKTLKNGSVGGIFISQVIEHLSFEYLLLLIELSMEKLTEGGIILMETLNPESLASLKYFYMDPSHVRLIPSATLEYVMESAGFTNIQLQHLNMSDSKLLLSTAPVTNSSEEWIKDLLISTNTNTHRINQLLFGPVDYAIIGEKCSG